MEKRSDRHIRDLVAHTAFQGLVANKFGCARISMMAGSKTAPFKGPNTDEPDQLSPDRQSGLQRTAGPYRCAIGDIESAVQNKRGRQLRRPLDKFEL